jgi:hypothetical protein
VAGVSPLPCVSKVLRALAHRVPRTAGVHPADSFNLLNRDSGIPLDPIRWVIALDSRPEGSTAPAPAFHSRRGGGYELCRYLARIYLHYTIMARSRLTIDRRGESVYREKMLQVQILNMSSALALSMALALSAVPRVC